MALKYKLLIATLLLSLTAFSQADTTKCIKCTVTLPCEVARQVAADLIKKDSVQAELAVTQDELFATQQIVELKDSTIITYMEKEEVYKQIIAAYEQKEGEYISIIKKLEKVNCRQKRTTKWFKTATSVLAATTLVLLLAK